MKREPGGRAGDPVRYPRAAPGQRCRRSCGQGVTAPQEPAVEAHPVAQVGLPLYLEHKGPVLPFPGPPEGPQPGTRGQDSACFLR